MFASAAVGAATPASVPYILGHQSHVMLCRADRCFSNLDGSGIVRRPQVCTEVPLVQPEDRA